MPDLTWVGCGHLRPPARVSALLAAWRGLVPWVYAALALAVVVIVQAYGPDAHAYYRAASDPTKMYSIRAQGWPDAYVYTPAFAQALAPFTLAGFHAFLACWTVLLLAVLWWLARGWALLVLFIPIFVPWIPAFTFLGLLEIRQGNIYFLLAAAVVLSLRWPGAWAFPLLTKPTMGVGLLWYVVRRDWHGLALALGTTAAIGAVSFLLAPELWSQWMAMLQANATFSYPVTIFTPLGSVPLVARLPLAGIVVAWGARSNRRWALLVGSWLAVPTFGTMALVMLAGLWSLRTVDVATKKVVETSGMADLRVPVTQGPGRCG